MINVFKNNIPQFGYNISDKSKRCKTFEVQMLNKGETGAMVFESTYLKVAVGDTVIWQSRKGIML